MSVPADYLERVYAGVLGKIIGVYLGRPVEGWSHQRILAELGPIEGYVHERRQLPLIVADDDISGTLIFLRALPDHGNRRDLSAEQIGRTWLNYLIEQRTVLWWGGMCRSTEHTAYLRLKKGFVPPYSGAALTNSRIVAEQIGAQIFIDGWAMAAPGDPDLAVNFARKAASVSHDGEAVLAAMVIAVIESMAFVERDIERLLDAATRYLPHDSTIYRLIADLRQWRAEEPDWQAARQRLAAHYGYDKFGGGCHVVPNHGAIILALLYGGSDFSRSLSIVTTCGWDTDCNAGNVGCILGIKEGLAGIDRAPVDWRGPVADRLYLPSADGGRAISDAATEALHVANAGRQLHGLGPLAPKGGARFHFELPGSVQGFAAVDGQVAIQNVPGHSATGKRSLALRFGRTSPEAPARVATATFIPPDGLRQPASYQLMACPTLYAGQVVRVGLRARASSRAQVLCRLFVQVYAEQDQLLRIDSPAVSLRSRNSTELSWCVPPTGGAPIARLGLEMLAPQQESGRIFLDYLTWDGEPEVVLGPSEHGGRLWQRAWVDAAEAVQFERDGQCYRIFQNDGRGLLIQGASQWRDYRVWTTAQLQIGKICGVAVRVQGMRRYYALLIDRNNVARLVKMSDSEQTLKQTRIPGDIHRIQSIGLEVRGSHLIGLIDDEPLLMALDPDHVLTSGAVALIAEEANAFFGPVSVQPLGR